MNNHNLVSLAQLSSLSSMGYLFLFDNDQLPNLNGLQNLTSITYGFRIDNHSLLTDFAPLSNLRFVGGSIEILYNQSLTDISALSPCNFTNSLSINGNTSLSVCDIPFVCNLIAQGNNPNFFDNAAGCSTFFEVFATCPTCLSNTKWHVNAAAASSGDGTSWAQAFKTLQEAIDAAGTCGIKEIWVAQGTYLPSVQHGGATNQHKTFYFDCPVELYGGFNGTEINRSDRNWRNQPTLFSGDLGTIGDPADNAFHVVWLENVSNSMRLDGFFIEQGNASGGMNGGGIFNYDGNPRISNCILRQNSADIGGGIYSELGNPMLTSCIFSENTAGAGGGFGNLQGSPQFSNCLFRGNTASVGGGFYHETGSPILNNCTMYGNSAVLLGGGILNSVGSSILRNCILWGNSAAIEPQLHDLSNSSATLNRCLVQGGCPGGSTCNILLTDDPQFENAAAHDFHLKACSPAIDAGLFLAVLLTDLDDNPRPVNGVLDLGVFEFQGTPEPGVTYYPDLDNDNFGDPAGTITIYIVSKPARPIQPRRRQHRLQRQQRLHFSGSDGSLQWRG